MLFYEIFVVDLVQYYIDGVIEWNIGEQINNVKRDHVVYQVFLDASSDLYMRICPSVVWSVYRSIFSPRWLRGRDVISL